MQNKMIDPVYEVVAEKGSYRLFRTEHTTGESVSFGKVADIETAFYLVGILNENKVSVHHAKDVVRDTLIGFLNE